DRLGGGGEVDQSERVARWGVADEGLGPVEGVVEPGAVVVSAGGHAEGGIDDEDVVGARGVGDGLEGAGPDALPELLGGVGDGEHGEERQEQGEGAQQEGQALVDAAGVSAFGGGGEAEGGPGEGVGGLVGGEGGGEGGGDAEGGDGSAGGGGGGEDGEGGHGVSEPGCRGLSQVGPRGASLG